MIYAFKSDGRSQTMEEHINCCLKTLEQVKSTRLWDDKLDEAFVKRAVVFHDLGKVFYQWEVGDLSFPGHEFISAYVFWKVFDEELMSKEEELTYLFPIIFHHHAMRIRGRNKRGGRLEVLEKYPLIDPSEEMLSEIERILKKYMDGEYAIKTVEVLRNVKAQQVVTKISNKIGEIWNMFHGKFARNCLRLLIIMIVCDYEGSRSRGGTTSFGRIIEETLKMYKML